MTNHSSTFGGLASLQYYLSVMQLNMNLEEYLEKEGIPELLGICALVKALEKMKR